MKIEKTRVGLGLALAWVAIGLIAPLPARAEWPQFGRAISTAQDGQTHSEVAGDGAGGAIIAWQDHRGPKVNVFAQHVLASGELDGAWPFDGTPMIEDTSLAGVAGGNFRLQIVADGAGGAIVAWIDLRDAAADRLDVFAQHVLATGEIDRFWPVNGVQLASAAGLSEELDMVSDAAGGAFVTWTDARPGGQQVDVYAQRVLATGAIAPGWPANGLAVVVAPGAQQFPAITEDGTGGAIIAWDDLRSSVSKDDVFAQHVLGSGTVDPAWPVNGRALCTASGDQGRVTIAPDGAQGAIVAWTDARVVGTDHIFAQHVLASGVVDGAWPVDGQAISNAGFLESRPLAVSDGAGGAVVAWQALAAHLNTFAQHVTAAGTVDPAWPAGGRALSITARNQVSAEIASDGLGGAIVAWEDSGDVAVQHVRANGSLDPAFPDTGLRVVELFSRQGDVALVATGDGGAIVAWTDTRNEKDADIYAMQVFAVGTTAVAEPPAPAAVTFAPALPNPARRALALRFALVRDASVNLDVYDASGRRVRRLVSGAQSAGSHTVGWDLRDANGNAAQPGLYFARLEVEGRALTQKLVTLR